MEPEITSNIKGLMHSRHRQEKYYNRTAKNLDTLKTGDRLRVQPVQPHKVWKTAQVLRPVSHRSYEVKLDSGGVLRRNRRHLRHNHNTSPTPTQTGTTQSSRVIQGTDPQSLPGQAVRWSGPPLLERLYTVMIL